MPSDSVDLWELQSVQCKRSTMDPTTVIYTVGQKVCLNFSHRCLSRLDIDPNRYCSQCPSLCTSVSYIFKSMLS